VAKTVLIAEDNALNRALFADILRQDGYAVREAADGPAALAAAREGPPALLLLDMDLPRLHGSVVARRLRADPACAGLTILAVSAHPPGATAREAGESGCDDWLAKPVRPDVLSRAVRAWIGAPDAGDRGP